MSIREALHLDAWLLALEIACEELDESERPDEWLKAIKEALEHIPF